MVARLTMRTDGSGIAVAAVYGLHTIGKLLGHAQVQTTARCAGKTMRDVKAKLGADGKVIGTGTVAKIAAELRA